MSLRFLSHQDGIWVHEGSLLYSRGYRKQPWGHAVFSGSSLCLPWVAGLGCSLDGEPLLCSLPHSVAFSWGLLLKTVGRVACGSFSVLPESEPSLLFSYFSPSWRPLGAVGLCTRVWGQGPGSFASLATAPSCPPRSSPIRAPHIPGVHRKSWVPSTAHRNCR